MHIFEECHGDLKLSDCTYAFFQEIHLKNVSICFFQI